MIIHSYNSSKAADINRPIDKVRGFTRETLIGMAASIETRVWHYHFNATYHLPLEHPRSSTTDDVECECFFSVLRDCVGKNFTSKQVYFEWRKDCLEFSKRMDKTLPFYKQPALLRRGNAQLQ